MGKYYKDKNENNKDKKTKCSIFQRLKPKNCFTGIKTLFKP